MTETKIENIAQLKAELSRLQSVAKKQEEIINDNLHRVHESLKPENIIRSLFGRLTGSDFGKKSVLRDGIMRGLSLLFHRFILRTEARAEEKVFDLLASGVEHF